MTSQEVLNDLVNVFFNLQLTNKLYHWSTKSYARHKATDDFDGVISSFLDRFVEYYSGRYNMTPNINIITIDPNNLTDSGIENLFIAIKKLLEKFDRTIKDTDLLTLRDELLGEVNKMLYLFRLK